MIGSCVVESTVDIGWKVFLGLAKTSDSFYPSEDVGLWGR